MKKIIELVNESIQLNKIVPSDINEAIDIQCKLVSIDYEIMNIAASLEQAMIDNIPHPGTDTNVGRIRK